MGTVQYNQRGERLPRIPSAHKRFVRRAATLATAPAFRTAVQDAQAAWNAAHPRFPIGLDGPIPEKPWGHPTNETIYPPDLSAAFLVLTDKLQRQERMSDAELEIHQAAHDWRALVVRFCAEWWPREYYPCPVGSGEFLHPCTRFVSACLVWQPRDVPSEWVMAYSHQVECLLYDPTEYDSNPDAHEWERTFNGFYERLDACLEAGDSITRETLDRAANEARRAAWEARRDENPRWVFGDGPAPFQFIRVSPWLTTTDWQRMGPQITEQLGRAEGNPLADQARQLHREGKSGKSIARLLGVTPRDVRRYLESVAR